MHLLPSCRSLSAAAAALLSISIVAQADLVVFSSRDAWSQAVGGGTIARSSCDYYAAPGQVVDPELWSDVGVHLAGWPSLVSSDYTQGGQYWGQAITTASAGPAFLEITWDADLNALWFHVWINMGSITLFHNDTAVGNVASGSRGVVSDLPFNRMRIVQPVTFMGAVKLMELEWATVPSPSAMALLGVGVGAVVLRRRRR